MLRNRRMTINFDFRAITACLGMAILAIFTGLIATTASPVLIALVVGLIGGCALLLAPRIGIWILIILGLTSGFVASIYPTFNKLPWALTLLSMLMLLPAMLKLSDVKKVPVFIWLALVFMVYALLVSLIQWHTLAQLLAGYKRYFQMFGLMFALALLAFKPEDYKGWLKLVLIIALMQLPFALYEYFFLAGLRGGRGVGVAEATDVVAGTLGANLEGGSANAQMAAFLIMAMAFLVARWREGLISRSRAFWLCLVCMLPLGLGETKIVILLLPLVWITLIRDDLKTRFFRFFIQLVGLLAVTSILGTIYLGLNDSDFSATITQMLSYNIGEQGYGTNILNRSTVLEFWWNNQSLSDPVGLLLGHGLGSAYFSPANPVPGHIALQYLGYGIDMTSASSLLWDTGLLGLLLFVSIFSFAWRAAGKLRKAARAAETRADALALQACLGILSLFVFYDSTLVNYLPFEVIAALVLGYLGYLVRQSHLEAHPTKVRAREGRAF